MLETTATLRECSTFTCASVAVQEGKLVVACPTMGLFAKNEVPGVEQVIAALQRPGKEATMSVSPFTLEATMEMSKILATKGCASLFDLSKAGCDLSVMCEHDLHVHALYMHASLSVHASGKASAVAGERSWCCTRPCLVVLLCGRGDKVLLVGRLD